MTGLIIKNALKNIEKISDDDSQLSEWIRVTFGEIKIIAKHLSEEQLINAANVSHDFLRGHHLERLNRNPRFSEMPSPNKVAYLSQTVESFSPYNAMYIYDDYEPEEGGLSKQCLLQAYAFSQVALAICFYTSYCNKPFTEEELRAYPEDTNRLILLMGASCSFDEMSDKKQLSHATQIANSLLTAKEAIAYIFRLILDQQSKLITTGIELNDLSSKLESLLDFETTRVLFDDGKNEDSDIRRAIKHVIRSVFTETGELADCRACFAFLSKGHSICSELDISFDKAKRQLIYYSKQGDLKRNDLPAFQTTYSRLNPRLSR